MSRSSRRKQRLLVRKIAVLETELNAREQRFAEQGQASDEELLGYATGVNAQRRLLADIGSSAWRAGRDPELWRPTSTSRTTKPSPGGARRWLSP